MSKNKKFTICLPGSEHRAVRVKLVNVGFSDTDDRCADVTFKSDAMDVKLYMMESDLRILGLELLENTKDVQPIKTVTADIDLTTEVHRLLNKEEMDYIKVYREALAYKTAKQADKLFEKWVVGSIDARLVKLLSLYMYG